MFSRLLQVSFSTRELVLRFGNPPAARPAPPIPEPVRLSRFHDSAPDLAPRAFRPHRSERNLPVLGSRLRSCLRPLTMTNSRGRPSIPYASRTTSACALDGLPRSLGGLIMLRVSSAVNPSRLFRMAKSNSSGLAVNERDGLWGKQSPHGRPHGLAHALSAGPHDEEARVSKHETRLSTHARGAELPLSRDLSDRGDLDRAPCLPHSGLSAVSGSVCGIIAR